MNGSRPPPRCVPSARWAARHAVARETSMPLPPRCSYSMPSRSHVRRRARAGLAVAMLAVAAGCGGSSGGPTIRVNIPPGSNFSAAVDSLSRAGVIGSPRLFRLYASARGRDRSLKAGTYGFQRSASWNDVLDALTRGTGLVHSVTIPEGFALSSIAPLLGRALSVPPESVLVAATDSAL